MTTETNDPEAHLAPAPPRAPVRGSCLCGRFRFVVRGVRFLKNCHCSRCRKISGSSFLTYARAHARGLTILAGASEITTYEHAPGTVIAFCRHCGSVVPHPPPGALEVEFPAGLLDDDPGVDVTYHVHAASRAPWIVIDDGLPCFEAMNPMSMPDARVARERRTGDEETRR